MTWSDSVQSIYREIQRRKGLYSLGIVGGGQVTQTKAERSGMLLRPISTSFRASQVAQWLRTRLPMQKTGVWSVDQEAPLK